MPKLTVLEMVQSILNSMSSDEVNSISDTTESQQIAQILKDTYFAIVSNPGYRFLKELFELEATSIDSPSTMKIPERISMVETLKYNKRSQADTRDNWADIQYLTPEEFLDYIMVRNTDDDSIDSVEDISTNVTLLIKNDAHPKYWTSFDDEYIVFDSYESSTELSLQSSKTQCFGVKSPTFTLTNSFIPDLPENMFPLLLSEAKLFAKNELSQFVDQLENQRAATQRRRVSSAHAKTVPIITYPNYGRK